MEPVVETLKGLFRHGVGLQTKVGAAKFVAALGVLHPAAFSSYASTLLDAAFSGCTDRSEVVRGEMAGAVAILARLAPIKKVSKFLLRLRDYYADGSDPAKSLVVAGALRRLTQQGEREPPPCAFTMFPAGCRPVGPVGPVGALWENRLD